MSKVFFSDLKTKSDYSLLVKLDKLIERAGISEIDFKGKLVALKIHVGEYGNMAFIRPPYVRVIVDKIKKLGGKPFLTDASTLYTGSRSNAVDHLNNANLNGFTNVTTGCDVIIADGLKGTDYKEVKVDLKHCSTAKIGSAIYDADIILSINHFKGHEMTGFGGAIKNLGMGCGSRLGKLEMHSLSKPDLEVSKCASCGECKKGCAQKAISFGESKKASIDYDKCVGCGECIVMCKYDAITPKTDDDASRIINEKIVEYTYAVLKDKPHFHINFLMNISPNCDCWNCNDAAITPDIGMLASFDPVALDFASAQLVNEAPSIENSRLKGHKTGDKFHAIHKKTDWMSQITYAEDLGIGTKEYELLDIDKKSK